MLTRRKIFDCRRAGGGRENVDCELEGVAGTNGNAIEVVSVTRIPFIPG